MKPGRFRYACPKLTADGHFRECQISLIANAVSRNRKKRGKTPQGGERGATHWGGLFRDNIKKKPSPTVFGTAFQPLLLLLISDDPCAIRGQVDRLFLFAFGDVNLVIRRFLRFHPISCNWLPPVELRPFQCLFDRIRQILQFDRCFFALLFHDGNRRSLWCSSSG